MQAKMTNPTASSRRSGASPSARLGDLMFRRRGRVVLAWSVGLVVLAGAGSALAGEFDAEYSTPGSPAPRGLITAPAAIMVFVFLAFLVADEVFLKLLGIGMATAILVDATIVRMVLVPAVMQLGSDVEPTGTRPAVGEA
jgi:hypothetical protein